MKAGKLVPDDVVLAILKKELDENAKGKSVLLDGFPRTNQQAINLADIFKVDAVVSLDIPHKVIIERLGNRWIHAASGRTYSYDYSPPKVHGMYRLQQEFDFKYNFIFVSAVRCVLLLLQASMT